MSSYRHSAWFWCEHEHALQIAEITIDDKNVLETWIWQENPAQHITKECIKLIWNMNKKNHKLRLLQSENPKEYWKIAKGEKTSEFYSNISLDIWREHFEKLALGNESGEVSDTNGELYTSEKNVYYDINFFCNDGTIAKPHQVVFPLVIIPNLQRKNTNPILGQC